MVCSSGSRVFCLPKFWVLVLLSAFGTAGLLGCPPPGPSVPAPAAGYVSYQVAAFVPVGHGASVNIAGGNLYVRRVDLSLDTRLGGWSVTAAYNSATGEWRRNFEMRYDPQSKLFVDDTGAEHDLSTLNNGDRVPGTHWVRLGAAAVKTIGGMKYTFDSEGLLSEARWTSSDYPRIKYVSATVAGEKRVVAIDQCLSQTSCENVYTMHYDSGTGRLDSITDRAGRTAAFTYFGSGLLQTAQDGKDVAEGWPGFRYAYSGADLTSIMNSEGEEVAFAYTGGSALRVRSATRVGAAEVADIETTFAYSKVGGQFRTTITDELGHETAYTYDGQRRIRTFELPTGDTTSTTWGFTTFPYRPTSVSDPAGVTTAWAYPDDNTVEEHQPSGNVVVTEFAPLAGSHSSRGGSPIDRPVLQVTDSLGVVSTHSFDAGGRLSWTENGEGERTSFTYDGYGRVTRVDRPTGTSLTFSGYGNHGHATSVTSPDFTDTRTFDSMGNQLTGIDISGANSPGRPGVLSRAFDEDRNLVRLVMADNSNLTWWNPATSEDVHITYRSDGQMLAVRRPYGGPAGGGDTEFDYDAMGRQVARRDRADGVFRPIRYEYDARGFRSAVTRPNGPGGDPDNGMRTETDYDASGRVSAMRHVRNGAVQEDIVYQYLNGRLVAKLDSAYGAPEAMTYDDAGRLEQVVFPGGEETVHSYDVRSRLAATVYIDSDDTALKLLSSGYDLANRMTSLSDGGASVVSRTFGGSRLTQEVFGNGLTRTYSYDAVTGRLVQTETVDGGNQTKELTTVVHDFTVILSLISVDVGVDSTTWDHSGTATTTAERYALTTRDHTGGYTMGPRLMGDDPTSVIGGAVPNTWDYRYDALGNLRAHHVLNDPEPTYNAERNRLLTDLGHTYSYDGAGFVTNRDGRTLTWTANGRIASIGGDTFKWDSEGRPIQRKINGKITNMRFGGAVEANGLGSLKALDLGFVRLALDGSSDLYRHQGFRKNYKFVTDESGDVIKHWNYRGFRVTESHGPSNDDRNFAQGIDIGDGLILLGERVYDSEVGRFLSKDPVFQVGSQYTYTSGNPIWLWDPDGRQSYTVDPISGGDYDYSAGGYEGLSSAYSLGNLLIGMGTALERVGESTLGAVATTKLFGMKLPGAAQIAAIAGAAVTGGQKLQEIGHDLEGTDGSGADGTGSITTGSVGAAGGGDRGFPGAWDAAALSRMRGSPYTSVYEIVGDFGFGFGAQFGNIA